MGLTLAPDSQSVYWVVRSYEGSALFHAPMADQLQPGQVVAAAQVSQLCASMQGPLCYFSHHLLWLQDDRNAVIGDLSGQNAAVITGTSLSHLHTVTIMDPSQQRIPGTVNVKLTPRSTDFFCCNFLVHLTQLIEMFSGDLEVEPDVIPKAVSQSSIRVSGTWESFNISWNPVSNVNYGQVFYEVKVRDGTGKEMNVSIMI